MPRRDRRTRGPVSERARAGPSAPALREPAQEAGSQAGAGALRIESSAHMAGPRTDAIVLAAGYLATALEVPAADATLVTAS